MKGAQMKGDQMKGEQMKGAQMKGAQMKGDGVMTDEGGTKAASWWLAQLSTAVVGVAA